MIALTAFISPFHADRQRVRELVAEGDFLEIYCRCSLEVCEQRDVKGRRRARQGEIKEFTGISSPYEAPVNPDLVLDTDTASLEECVDKVIGLFHEKGVLPKT